MVTDSIVDKLRDRYFAIHPMIFHRSVERARSDGDLFDILDSFPEKYPVVWCELTYRWVVVDDICQTDEFFGEL